MKWKEKSHGKPLVMMLGKLSPPVYGTTVWYDIVCKEYIPQRSNVIFINIGVHSKIDEIGSYGISVVYRNIKNYILLLFKIVLLRPVAIHMPISQSVKGLLRDSLFILIGWMSGRRIALHLHGSILDEVVRKAPLFLRLYIRWVLKRAYLGVVLSRRFKYIFENLGIYRIIQVRNGADYCYDQINGDGTVRLLYLSNLQPSKGILEVVKSIALLGNCGTRYVLDIVGAWRDDKTRNAIERIVVNYSLPVVFHGPKYGSDKQFYYALADIFIFTPMEQEGHPWVINEALAAGLPIVASRRGMIEDAVEDGVNGYVLSEVEPEEIADKIREIIVNDELRLAMGLKSRSKYTNGYRLCHMIAELDEMINKLVS